jgi:chemotaxis protein methyltransferase CheR
MARPSSFRRTDRLARAMEQDAYLMLGAAETVVALTDRFQPIAGHRGLYAPNPSALEAISNRLASS